MRTLSLEELELVAGGNQTINGIPVTDLPGPTVTPDPGDPSTGTPIPGGDGTGGAGNGGTGGGSTGSGTGLTYYWYQTSGGHTFSTALSNLNQTQVNNLATIVDYGYSHGYNQGEVALAALDAFHETSIGLFENNGTHKGMFQYDDQTWADLKHEGLITDDMAQIKAIYDDISKYEQRYHDESVIQHKDLPTFDDYFEVKHEYGNNSENWTGPMVDLFNQQMNQMDFMSH